MASFKSANQKSASVELDNLRDRTFCVA